MRALPVEKDRGAIKVVFNYKPKVVFHNYGRLGIRCAFWVLKWANGCHLTHEGEPGCRYCWLRAYHPWDWNEIHAAPKEKIEKALEKHYKKQRASAILINTDELCDSLVCGWDYISFICEKTRELNKTYGKKNKILVLTKDAPNPIEGYEDVMVYSISISSKPVEEAFEPGPPPIEERIEAAKNMKDLGYEIRVRMDPIFIEFFGEHLAALDIVCRELEPDLITFGTLRATKRSMKFLPRAITFRIRDWMPWGKGYEENKRITAYSDLVRIATNYGIKCGLCKEPPYVWQQAGISSGKCNCIL